MTTTIRTTAFSVPMGCAPDLFLKKLLKRRKKVLLYSPFHSVRRQMANRLNILGFNVCYVGSRPFEETYRAFSEMETGVFILGLQYVSGFRFDDVDAVVFMEANLQGLSAHVHQASARSDASLVHRYFVNCLNIPREFRPDSDTARKIARPSRRPLIYYKSGAWRVQIGKRNFSFWSFDRARRYAIVHYKFSNDRNWQLYRFSKTPSNEARWYLGGGGRISIEGIFLTA